jgi:glyceraldehyde 3-phosphate dehydrogenase
MPINVAINGFGRIGRMILRAGIKNKKINFVAINDLTDPKTLAHLLKYDTAHGTMKENITSTSNSIKIGKKEIKVFSEKDPNNLPWKKLKIDVAIESTGFFRKPKDASLHLKAGAKKVLLSAAPKCEDNNCPDNVIVIVPGVNYNKLKKDKHNIVSNASCTTNCVAPILSILQKHIGISRCYFTTIHSYTSDQKLQDAPHKDLRRSRAAASNIIPTSTYSGIER